MDKYIFAVGHIDKGGHAIVTSAQQEQDFCDAYTLGEMDREDGFEARPLHHFRNLLCVEQYLLGYRGEPAVILDPAYAPDWPTFLEHAARVEAEDGPVPWGILLTEDDLLEDTFEYENDIEDREFIRKGGA